MTGALVLLLCQMAGLGQDALCDSDGHAIEGAAAVGFQVRLVVEGVADRFGQLADGFGQRLAAPGCSSLREGRLGLQGSLVM